MLEFLVVVAPPLAHAGEGATWQALLTTLSAGVVIVFALALARKVELASPGDLVVPLAFVVVLSAFAPSVSDFLSDLVGYAMPVGAVLLVALLGATRGWIDLRGKRLHAAGAVAVAIAASALAGPALTDAWHPQPLFFVLPEAIDIAVRVVAPEDGATVETGIHEVAIEVTGGTIGPAVLEQGEIPDDPRQLGNVRVFLGAELLPPPRTTGCTAADPCTRVTLPVELVPGTHQIAVEFVTWDGLPFSPPVTHRVLIEARAEG